VTPLHSAVAAKHRDTASLSWPSARRRTRSSTAAGRRSTSAARNGDEAIVDMLLLRGADPTRKSDDGKTAIDLAEENGHAALAGLLRGRRPGKR
jgi:ankyrin repeat protein